MKTKDKEAKEEKERLEFFAALRRLSDRELHEMHFFVLTQILDAIKNEAKKAN